MADNQQPATKQDLLDLESKLLEAMRDMQTEMLRGLERFAKGNFTRFHRLETTDQTLQELNNVLNDRVTALEERVLALEVRQPPPTPAPPQS